jgi:hypothetical protein
MRHLRLRSETVVFGCVLALWPVATAAASNSFIGSLNTVSVVASTIPGNGDQNPYGTAVVPRSTGALVQGNVLVSNFNNSSNQQGTGSTIVEVAPDGMTSVFAQLNPGDLPGPCPGGIGLTTALVVLRRGWVVVGSLPTSDGTAATAEAGCLIVLDRMGKPVETISGAPINGPWDMTAFDGGQFVELFVTNVLNFTVTAGGDVVNKGTVVRLILTLPEGEMSGQGEMSGDGEMSHGEGMSDEGEMSREDDMPRELQRMVIASGFGERTDPAALVVGPTGVGLSGSGTLYVADTVGNRIAAIPNAVFRFTSAGTGQTVSANGNLNSPLGLAIAPNGDILTVNAGDGNIVETTPGGSQVAVKTLDNTGSPPGAGDLFGLAITPDGKGVYFVDDASTSNNLNLLH